MRRLILGLALFVASCGPIVPPKPPTPPTPPPETTVSFDLVACKEEPKDNYCAGPANAKFALNTHLNPDEYLVETGDGNGYVFVKDAPALPQTFIKITAEGFDTFDTGTISLLDLVKNNDAGNHNFYVLKSEHFDPWLFSAQDVLNFRGSLFTAREGACVTKFNPRPNDPTNILYFSATFYSPNEWACAMDRWSDVYGYTHGVMGPFIDPGYHDLIPAIDFRADPQPVIDLVAKAWDRNLAGKRTIPILAIVPDHWGADKGFADHVWTVQDLKELEPIYRSPEFQRIARAVMLCWECQGSKYGWANHQYVEYAQWLADVFPNSIRILHTISEIEAPVGNGDETDTSNCKGKTRGYDCLTNGEAWANVTKYFHAWFFQSNAMFYPGSRDPQTGVLDSDNWYKLWDVSNPASFFGRFHNGFAGWPTTSANKPDVNGGHFCAVAGEYRSMVSYWENADEQLTLDIGAKVLTLGGSCGFMDGGRVK